MPIEGAKEVAKVVVESSGSASSWIVAGFVAATSSVAAMWKYLTKKMSKVEQDAIAAKVIKDALDAHIEDENGKFDVLFQKHDSLHETVTSIRESVARIEGRLER